LFELILNVLFYSVVDSSCGFECRFVCHRGVVCWLLVCS